MSVSSYIQHIASEITRIVNSVSSQATIISQISTVLESKAAGGDITVSPITITQNGTTTAPAGTAYSPVTVAVPAADLNLETVSITPTESTQSRSAGAGYDAIKTVNVSAIPTNYVGSSIARKSSTDLSVSGATVTAPAGYYAASASKSVASGSAGTPVATKGTVTNHSITVTPSITSTAGYIVGGSASGTPVTVTASELTSGSETKTKNGTYDVTNLAQLVVNVSGGGGTYEIEAETMPNYVHNSYVTLGMTIDSEGNLYVSKVSGSGTANNLVICEGWDGTTFNEDNVITKVDIPQAEGTYTKNITVWWDNSSGVHGDNTSKGKTDANKWTISYTVISSGSGDVTVRPLSVTANGTYTAPSGTAYSPVTVNVSGGGSKNVQLSTVMKNIKSTTMTTTGASITVSKTGTYKCTWVHWAQAAGSSYSNYFSQLYVANATRGSVHYAPVYNNATATNYICTENNVSLTEGQKVEVRARSQSANNFINAGMLIIEEQ